MCSKRLGDAADAKEAAVGVEGLMDWERTAAVGAAVSGSHLQRKRHAKTASCPSPIASLHSCIVSPVSPVRACLFRALGFPSLPHAGRLSLPNSLPHWLRID